MKTKIIIFIAALFFIGCGSKKSVSQSQVKEKTDIELTDNSIINTKIEQEKQYIDTHIKERIVTLYGVRFDTIYVDGEPVVTPTSYPVKKEEEREILIEMIKEYASKRDSIQNDIELKYKSQLDEKDKKILESKESTQALQVSILIGSIAVLALIFISIFGRKK